MANTITGRIIQIGNTEQVATKDLSKAFLRREIVIDATRFDPWTGERSGFENTLALEFGGDKCAELDHYQVGQVVTITFDLQGVKYEKDGMTKYFTKARPYKIEARQVQQQQVQQRTQVPVHPTSQQQNQQAPPQNYQQQQPYYQQPPNYPPQPYNEEPPF